MSVLVISEKDDAAKRIARMLSGGTAKASKKGKAPVHTFERDGETYHVIGLKGHLVALDYPKDYRNWRKTDLRDLIQAEPKKKVERGKKAIMDALKSLAKDAERVVVATDYDREGELIGVEALDVIRKAHEDVPIFRARFSSLTKKAIERAFENLVEVDYNLASSAESRQYVDLAWGATLTRFISLTGRARRGQYLSVGRVQSPTLAVLVDKEREIKAFVPEPYWEITAYVGGDMPFEAPHANGRFEEQEAADAAFANADGAKEAKVVSFDTKDVTERAPSPFNTTEFQRQASSNLSMTAKRAMDVAERLYMEGYISYPRTDNTVYPPEEDLDDLLAGIAKIPEYKGLVDQLKEVRRGKPTRGKKQATDHPPIHPMEPARKTDLANDEWSVYDLVVRRFLATLAVDAKGEDRSMQLEIGSEPFKASGYRLLKPGWRTFYPFIGRKKPALPDAAPGDTLPVDKVEIVEKETQPPRRYGQAGIISKMEELGLGTKSTRHEILQRLSDRKYVKSPSTLEPTETAFAVMDALERFAEIVTKPEMTATLEKEMEQVAEGEKTLDEVDDDSREMLEEVLTVLEKNKDELAGELREALRKQARVGPCPTCGKDLLVRTARKTGKRFIGCSGWPDCKQTYPLPQGGYVESMDTVCEACGAPEMRILKRGRRPWEFCANMDCPKREERQAAQGQSDSKSGSSDGASSEASDEKAEASTGD